MNTYRAVPDRQRWRHDDWRLFDRTVPASIARSAEDLLSTGAYDALFDLRSVAAWPDTRRRFGVDLTAAVEDRPDPAGETVRLDRRLDVLMAAWFLDGPGIELRRLADALARLEQDWELVLRPSRRGNDGGWVPLPFDGGRGLPVVEIAAGLRFASVFWYQAWKGRSEQQQTFVGPAGAVVPLDAEGFQRMDLPESLVADVADVASAWWTLEGSRRHVEYQLEQLDRWHEIEPGAPPR